MLSQLKTKKMKIQRSEAMSKKYQKKSHLEHILLRSETYIGSVNAITEDNWVINGNNKMENREITYVPGLLKIFDEILVNASDNKQRDPSMKSIKVSISNNTITVENDGMGIPVVLHETENIYIPQMIMGSLLSGDNYDDDDERVVGGRNGYGAKLANIFSTTFQIETVDSKSGKFYSQTWEKNMKTVHPPKIKASGKKKDFTRVIFAPDFAKFGLTSITDDILSLFKKRTFDMAGTSPSDVNVYFNGDKIPVKTFKQYCQQYIPEDVKLVHEKINDRWEVCIAVSNDQQGRSVSFCNGISTSKGGTHVNFLLDDVSKIVASHRSLAELNVRPSQIKSSVFVFVNAMIVNPSFDSQTKETLTTRSNSFGPLQFKPKLSAKTAQAILKRSGIVDEVLFYAKAKSQRLLQRKTASRKTSKITGIPKLDDAKRAGTSRSAECTLILTEGDSAKSLAIAGLSVIGRDNFGVFPLKGKLRNVRDASNASILQNVEVQNIMKIMGLNIGNLYEDVSRLRYGSIMIMTDQDHDGSHIKGLIINFLHHFWPSLLAVPNFLQVFITPIVKCTKGNQVMKFYTTPEYDTFVSSVNIKQWKVKYYKGLGTSNAKEAKEYFSNLDRNRLHFEEIDTDGGQLIDLCFSKARVEDRKSWILNYSTGTFIDFTQKRMTYEDFINKELVIMAVASNLRGIPNVIDGLKPSQRKILFSCLKRNLKEEIKVAQLSGYVSEHAAYHHGEMSLNGCIINMAQDFVGSNNINLLKPNGQFGSRLLGGKDAASPRYVFTKLSELTSLIYHPDDATLYTPLEDDGMVIEPYHYTPIIPMVLVNGAVGIGTGWSTSIPQHNPLDIIQNIEHMLDGIGVNSLVPWYRGFTGTVMKKGDDFVMNGAFNWKSNTCLHITELPVGVWTSGYKEFLEKASAGEAKGFKKGMVTRIISNYTDTLVDFNVHCSQDFATILRADRSKVLKLFKLDKKIQMSNMHAFTSEGKIKKYANASAIIDDFFPVRMRLYQERKKAMVLGYQQELTKANQTVKFLQLVLDNTFVFKGQNKNQLKDQLKSFKLDNAEFLLQLPIYNLTDEKMAGLLAKKADLEASIRNLQKCSVQSLWKNDLKNLREALQNQTQPEEIKIRKSSKKRK